MFSFSIFVLTPLLLTGLPSRCRADSEPVALRMFSRSSEPAPLRKSYERVGAVSSTLPHLGESTVGDSGLEAGNREKAVRLNEQGVELVLQGDRTAGIVKIREALDVDPHNTTILYNLAGLYLAEGDANQAMTLMQRALELEPQDLSFLNRYAESALSANDVSRALASYERIAQTDPRFNEVLLKLGTLYAMRQDWDKAENALRRAKEQMGNDPRVLSNLGSVLVVREKYHDAVRYLERAQRKTKTAENAVVLGIASESLGRFSDALRYYREAQSLGEKGADLEQHIRRLETVTAAATEPQNETPQNEAKSDAAQPAVDDQPRK